MRYAGAIVNAKIPDVAEPVIGRRSRADPLAHPGYARSARATASRRADFFIKHQKAGASRQENVKAPYSETHLLLKFRRSCKLLTFSSAGAMTFSPSAASNDSAPSYR
jgi:hypothetical protein